MTAGQVEALLRRCGHHNVYMQVDHATRRGEERNITINDVLEALRNHHSLKLQANGRWRAAGPDLDGDDLTVVFVVEADIVIITVM